MESIIPDEKKQSLDYNLWDEFLDFYYQLKDMIYEDFRNSYLFLKSNKNYVVTAVILTFLLQFSSISNLGVSFDKYCSKTDVKKQMGGASPPVELRTFQEVGKERANAERESKKQAKQQKEAAAQQASIDKNIKKGLTRDQAIDKAQKKLDKKQKARDDAAMSKGKRQVKLAFTEGEKESRQQEQLMKANKERLSFFEGLKKKFGGKSLGNTLGGPLFGNMDLIFDSVKHIFYIISIILTIAGIISLPVMIFLIITYTIMKAMVAKFTVL
jgi:hypothetical protein